MARQRMLHPGFFTDADLCDCSPVARLFFAGLWTVADREGRLEDRPRELKVKILPFDDYDPAALLDELERGGFVQRYEAGGRHYLFLPKFTRYQKPHPRESPSELPKSPEKARPGREKVVPGREKDMTSRAESESESESVSKSVAVEGTASPDHHPKITTAHIVTRPTTAPDGWVGSEFWAWFQFKRQEAGFVAEPGPPRTVNGWYSTTMMTIGGNVEALQEAVYRFGEDKHWQRTAPPLPWAAFAKCWTNFLPRGVAHAES